MRSKGPRERIIAVGEETEFNLECRLGDKKDLRTVELRRSTSLQPPSVRIWKLQNNTVTLNSEYSKRLVVTSKNPRHGKIFTFKLRNVTVEDAGKYIFEVYYVGDSRLLDVFLYVKGEF